MPSTQSYDGTITVTISAESIDSLVRDSLVVGCFADEKPPRGLCGFADWRLNGLISRYMAQGTIRGTFMEKVLITPERRIPAAKLLLIGLGESSALSYDGLYRAGMTIAETLAKLHCSDGAFDIPLPYRCGLSVSEMTQAMISGYADGALAAAGNDMPAVSVLSDDSYRDEITLGINQFKVNVTHRIRVVIRDA